MSSETATYPDSPLQWGMSPQRRRLLTALERVDADLHAVESELLSGVRPKGYGGALQDETSVDTPDEVLRDVFVARRRTGKLFALLRDRAG